MRTVTVYTVVLAAALVASINAQNVSHLEFFVIQKFIGHHALAVTFLAAEVVMFGQANFRTHHSEL